MFITTLLVAAVTPLGDDDPATFSAPVQLTTGGQGHEGILYPTPVLQDLDGDSKPELVVGDLMGNLWVSHRVPSDSDLTWSARKAMKSGAEPLKLNNW